MKKILVLASILALTACTRPEHARGVLESNGYTDVVITGWNPLSCSEDDATRTGFEAKMNGKTVTGTVCSGWIFKGSTIRFD